MFHRVQTNLPTHTLNVTYYNGQRYYQSPKTLQWYPSVTTVVGFSKQSFFTEWRKDPANELNLKNAQERGESFHTTIEKYLQNDPNFLEGQNNNIKTLFRQLEPKLKNINNIVAQESPLFSDTLRLAGRFDCIAEYDKELSIIDFKGSNKSKRKDWIQNYFEQCACYSIMFQELYGIKISNIVVLVSSDDGTTQVFKEKVKNHIVPLGKTIKSFWKQHHFNTLQESINKGMNNVNHGNPT